MFEKRKIQAIIRLLESDKKEDRRSASGKLRSLAKKGISADGEITLMRAAAQRWPDRGRYDDPCEELLTTFFDRLRPETAQLLVELFDKFTEGGRSIAVNCLARQSDPFCTKAYLEVVRRYARKDLIEDLWTAVFKLQSTQTASALFPALLDYLDVPTIRRDVEYLVFEALAKGLLAKAVVAPYIPQILSHLDEVYAALAPLQQPTGVRWMWTEQYRKFRSNAALLLDLAGYLDAGAVASTLERWTGLTDPVLLLYASQSLLRLDRSVDPRILDLCASFPESRNRLFDFLERSERKSLFPTKYRKQRYLAESDMVRWLTFGTELDTVPDEIELMKVIETNDEEDGWMDYYLFRFRTFEPHWSAKKGWQAGISGPFKRSERPSTNHHGATFSCFEPWDSKSPMEHFEEIVAVTSKYWERMAAEEEE